MNKIVVACDSFKGCLSSREVARAVAEGITSRLPHCRVDQVAMADGGEGTVDALTQHWGERARWATTTVPAPLPELAQVPVRYAVDQDSGTAVMEVAMACGLPLVPPERRDVMRANTLGVGMMLLHAIEGGSRRIVLGLGGSATCDGGLGLMAALGVEFVDDCGRELEPVPSNLLKIAGIDRAGIPEAVLDTHYTLLADVTSPLCGPNGAALTFAPQKGATPGQAEQLETGMEHLSALLGCGRRYGTGAAGGVGAAMTALLPHCEIVAGAEYVIQSVSLPSLVAGADLVVTGEGRFDEQTRLGKTPHMVARVARAAGVPVIGLCGSTTVTAVAAGFGAIVSVTPPGMPLDEAMQPAVARANIARAATGLLRIIKTKN